jgi:UDP-N-acetyl-D-mannosaminuronic acid dehydrogenase
LIEANLRDLDGRRIAVFGVAYKGNVSDARNSPGLQLARRLTDRASTAGEENGGVAVRLHDPHVDDESVDADLVSFEGALRGADALVLATGHDEFGALTPSDVAPLMRGRLIVDAKALLDPEDWRRGGFDVEEI